MADNRERQLLLILQDLVKTARRNRGVLTQQELDEALSPLDLDAQQEQLVAEYLRQNDIGIDDPLEDDLRMSGEEKDYLAEYEETLAAIVQPSEGEKDAMKIRAIAGEEDAQRELARVLLPIVPDIARLYAGQGVYMEDLVGAGNEALVRGVKLLAPLEGPQDVEGALAERIMNAMEDLVAAGLDDFGVDQSAAELANKVMEKAEELAEALGRKVTAEELAAEGELTEEEILDAIRITAGKIEALETPQT